MKEWMRQEEVRDGFIGDKAMNPNLLASMINNGCARRNWIH
jgi:hypothetical protein